MNEMNGLFFDLIEEKSRKNDNITDIPDELPLLALRELVIFPGNILPIAIGRKKSLNLIKEVEKNKSYFATVTQKDSRVEEPKINDLFKYGTLVRLVRIIDIPGQGQTAIVEGIERLKLKEITGEEPYLKGKFEIKPDPKPKKKDKIVDAKISLLKDAAIKYVKLTRDVPEDFMMVIKNMSKEWLLLNYIALNLDVSTYKKQKLLEISSFYKRLDETLSLLYEKINLEEIKKDIELKVKKDLDKQQKEFILNQQIKAIQKELGENPIEQEYQELKNKSKKKKWPENVAEHFEKELKKLRVMNPAMPDYSMQLNYLNTLVDLPWEEYTKDNLDLKHAENVLNRDHYGLEDVKERILEHLAVIKLKKNKKAPIICLYGPPGVGKTSLGKSIADALGRKYVRVSLGGLHDEAEIRGHRRTYIGAMPGRIIQNLKKAKSSNPVFVLDEIDRIGKDFRGDPASALLEVLDPEQNNSFYDNYLELEYDLSKVMFIATANVTSTIHPALLDRMELIEVTGYTTEEKIEIAKRHLIPKQLSEHGLEKNALSFSSKVIEKIIKDYTRESGVRTLDKTLAKIIRRYAKKLAYGEEIKKVVTINHVKNILGPRKFFSETYEGNNFAGVVIGLAWTAYGGSILFVETSVSRGNGRLTLTGNLGDVMKESATIALEYVKSRSKKLNIPYEIFRNYNVHLHVPEGAIPKDGPSAGITMVTALASVFTQRKIRPYLAMTGEITLRGRVLPVGGIKEKILAAKRAEIKEIILSAENKTDVEKIKKEYIKDLKFIYVKTIDEVLDYALLDEKVDDEIDFMKELEEDKSKKENSKK